MGGPNKRKTTNGMSAGCSRGAIAKLRTTINTKSKGTNKRVRFDPNVGVSISISIYEYTDEEYSNAFVTENDRLRNENDILHVCRSMRHLRLRGDATTTTTTTTAAAAAVPTSLDDNELLCIRGLENVHTRHNLQRCRMFKAHHRIAVLGEQHRQASLRVCDANRLAHVAAVASRQCQSVDMALQRAANDAIWVRRNVLPTSSSNSNSRRGKRRNVSASYDEAVAKGHLEAIVLSLSKAQEEYVAATAARIPTPLPDGGRLETPLQVQH
mmetsp:Transcript_11933/g.25833  ORF Transcript_11933/g.25833 Transcript_11933/m.25833 type:complete len:269 (+) Transcript_11933:81-887(+)